MSEYNEILSSKTWHRNKDPVAKIGYLDGASDGQTAVFQDCFNIGYKQGLIFGLELGFREAISSAQRKRTDLPFTEDQHSNCQICKKIDNSKGNVGDLDNIQLEKNTEYFSKYN